MRGNLSPMISANAWVESHVAYHSLEGQPQMIGSFITFPGLIEWCHCRDTSLTPILCTTPWTRMFMCVLDTFMIYGVTDVNAIPCVKDACVKDVEPIYALRTHASRTLT